jgi:hypothetical protein
MTSRTSCNSNIIVPISTITCIRNSICYSIFSCYTRSTSSGSFSTCCTRIITISTKWIYTIIKVPRVTLTFITTKCSKESRITTLTSIECCITCFASDITWSTYFCIIIKKWVLTNTIISTQETVLITITTSTFCSTINTSLT